MKNRITELERKLSKTKAGSVDRVELLNELFFEVVTGNADRARRLAQEADNLAEELNYQKRDAFKLRNRAVLDFLKPDPDRSQITLERAVQEFRDVQDKKGEAECLLFLGLIHWSKGNLEVGFRNMTQALEISREAGASIPGETV